MATASAASIITECRETEHFSLLFFLFPNRQGIGTKGALINIGGEVCVNGKPDAATTLS